MVHSIFCHLWKKSKMEKKFSPLPPLRKSPQESSIHVQERLSDLIPEAEGEISSSSTSVLVSSIRFGNFHSEIVLIKSIKSVKPRIEGYIIKIGEIPCFLNQLEYHDSVLSPSDQELEIKEELIKTTNSAIPLPRFETTQNQALDLVMDALKNLVSQVQNHNVDISVSNRIIISSINFCDYRFENSVLALNVDVMASAQECDSSVIIDPSSQSLFRLFFSTAAIVAVETVFDPGSVIVKPLSVAKVLDDYGEIRSCESQSHNDGKTDYVITVFDPGGNQ
ncbi:unnamed protein product [Trifolium pratense]|uniref:Uncharacterized protein n=1 Tax=Trifolium pratense TaxID=57577 RepID=A0ACB0MFN5_TRIPR|nr:unnamed protein product [Trifolium pratense]